MSEIGVERPRSEIVPTGCCPPFEPDRWEGKEVVWDAKPFLKLHLRSFLHVPIGMGRKVKAAMARIEAAHALPDQGLMLSDEKSAWGADLLIDVTGPVPGAEMTSLTGTFLTKVFEGPYRDAPNWAETMRAYVAARGRTLDTLYFAYTTCPACAKAYGKNYVVLFAKVT